MLFSTERMPNGFVHRMIQLVLRQGVGTITNVMTQDNVVVLTFDGGPHPYWTPQLLHILEKYHAQSTFFMIGRLAQDHPCLVSQVAQAGHVIGNHSWDHPSFPSITTAERIRQIRLCERSLAPYGRRLFRPPYGHQDLASCIAAISLGYKLVTWNMHARDWEDGQDAQWMADHLLSHVRPGNIIVLHDAVCVTRYISREPMLAALTMFLERASNRFRFVTIPELFRHGRVIKRYWHAVPGADFLRDLRLDFGYDYKQQ